MIKITKEFDELEKYKDKFNKYLLSKQLSYTFRKKKRVCLFNEINKEYLKYYLKYIKKLKEYKKKFKDFDINSIDYKKIVEGIDFVKTHKSELAIGKNEALKEIIISINNIFNNCEKEKIYFNFIISKIFDWNDFRKNKLETLFLIFYKIGIEVCPYCNRNFVSVFKTNKLKTIDYAIPDIDHYYSQVLYPYLALSLYNLIPSCNLCNSKFKHDLDTLNNEILNPYINGFEDKAFFKIILPNNDNILNLRMLNNQEVKDSCSLVIEEKSYTIPQIRKSIDIFDLENIYNEVHRNKAIYEILRMIRLYDANYINSVFEDYNKDNFLEKDLELQKYLLDEVDDFLQEPLAKLKHDMHEQAKEYLRRSP